MKMTDLFRDELEREAAGTRRLLERVPEGCSDWKPHEQSMPLGYLATLVATLPSLIVMMVDQDELDMNPPGGSRYKPESLRTREELVEAFDRHVAEACETLANTTDDHLLTPWRFLAAGRVVDEQPRHVMLRDAVFNDLAHHRGQLTVYLRLNSASTRPSAAPPLTKADSDRLIPVP
jgi:uncharacterized damage-inducible protein DinB